MVRRLIEDEESWLLECELREHDETLLSLTECSDRSCHELTRDEESRGKGSEVLVECLATTRFEETVIDFLTEVKRREILPVVSDLYIRPYYYTLGSTLGDRL